MTFIFIVSLMMATFGGPVHVTFDSTSLEACEKLRKIVSRELTAMSFRYEVSPTCEARKGKED